MSDDEKAWKQPHFRPVPANWKEGVEWTDQRHTESLAATILTALIPQNEGDTDLPPYQRLVRSNTNAVVEALKLAEAIVWNNRNRKG